MQIITRITPADLQQIQTQTATDASIADVITSLQSSKSTQQAPLNTSCPTCQVNGQPTGFLSATIDGTTYKVPCTTCGGVMLVHTDDGQLEPPVNPFEAALDVYRVLPADLNEALQAFQNSGTLDAMITSLQGNAPVGKERTKACPLCKVGGVSTGWVTVQNKNTICPLCVGQQKTVMEYELIDGKPSIYIAPYTEPQNPLPFPPEQP